MSIFQGTPNMTDTEKPLVLITGASGKIGTQLTAAFREEYAVVGLDRKPCPGADDDIVCDLTSADSLRRGLEDMRKRRGGKIAAVIHLAAYFDFSGETSPLYEQVNIKGTENLLAVLQDFEVGRFIYASTMLVHAPGVPGQKISESHPLAPKWAYPQSKAAAERAILENRGRIPCTILRLAGLYDDKTAVPT